MEKIEDQPVRFPTTRWWLLLQAGHTDREQRRSAMSQLITAYHNPIRAFVQSRRGVKAHEVDDITQDFLTLKWLERDFLDRVAPEKGRFRAFLVVSLARHVSNWMRDRGPDRTAESFYGDSPAGSCRPEEHFDRVWARGLIATALEQFREECAQLGRKDLWSLFAARVVGPIIEGLEAPPYSTLVRQFGFASPMQASNALVTAKRAFARILRAVLSELDGPVEDMESEINELLRMLGKGGRSK